MSIVTSVLPLVLQTIITAQILCVRGQEHHQSCSCTDITLCYI